MTRVLLLIISMVFTLYGAPWREMKSFHLKKDEIGKVLIKTSSPKMERVLQWRWTLYTDKVLVVHEKYDRIVGQNMLSLGSNSSFRKRLLNADRETYMKKLIILMIFLSPPLTYAMDGNGFLVVCRAQDDAMYASGCQGYVGAVLDNVYAAREAFNKLMPMAEQKKSFPKEARNCMPEPINNNQARLIIVKWLESHPESLNKRVTDDARTALWNAFPCQD